MKSVLLVLVLFALILLLLTTKEDDEEFVSAGKCPPGFEFSTGTTWAGNEFHCRPIGEASSLTVSSGRAHPPLYDTPGEPAENVYLANTRCGGP